MRDLLRPCHGAEVKEHKHKGCGGASRWPELLGVTPPGRRPSTTSGRKAKPLRGGSERDLYKPGRQQKSHRLMLMMLDASILYPLQDRAVQVWSQRWQLSNQSRNALVATIAQVPKSASPIQEERVLDHEDESTATDSALVMYFTGD